MAVNTCSRLSLCKTTEELLRRGPHHQWVTPDRKDIASFPPSDLPRTLHTHAYKNHMASTTFSRAQKGNGALYIQIDPATILIELNGQWVPLKDTPYQFMSNRSFPIPFNLGAFDLSPFSIFMVPLEIKSGSRQPSSYTWSQEGSRLERLVNAPSHEATINVTSWAH